ncbi:hypothetical protein A671_03916 [Salmonella enterica subsp. enterica serovar Dublin str. DG22]|uniref:Uncharacterized protein n=1 Tax=Salmonella enterica subsp. enterica serovar Dublin str. UC16 TaxID=1192688 RepID=M7S4I2_SALDU|nr:hypothetical protein A670_04912 [Salmonella enterica subsp. enterica serovar Dublin str. UC16]EPI66516.1 hypothetical protein A671_03916 [Salmonella enterica subsp. enterica serovar Dublin str. DG22]
MHSLTFFAVAPFKSVNYRRENKSRWFSPSDSPFLFLTIYSFLSLQRRSHLTRLHKVATWWIFSANYWLADRANNRSRGYGNHHDGG